MSHQLYEIWQTEEKYTDFQWRVQLFDYIAQFPTKESAEKYVAAVKTYRATHGMKEGK